MDEAERYADPLDAGSARAEQWLADQLAEAQYQLSNSIGDYLPGECRNCSTKTDDGRAFCNEECRDDFSYRQKINKRLGRI